MLEGPPRRLASAAVSVSVALVSLAATVGAAAAASPDDIGAVAFQRNHNRAQSFKQTDYRLAQRSRAEHSRVNISWRGVDNTLRNGVPNLLEGADRRECTTPRYDWCQLDRLLRGYVSIRLPVNPVLIGTPEWANKRTCAVGRRTHACHPAPIAMGAWQAFVASAVRRYGPGGDYWNRVRAPASFDMEVWEVWNEPDLHIFWDGKSGDSPARDAREYADLVQATAHAVHTASNGPHGARVAGPSVSSFRPSNPGPWLTTFAAQDARSRVDVASGHLYGDGAANVVAQVDRYRQLFPNRPMWITENGFGSSSGCRPCVGSPLAQRNQFRQLMDRLGDRPYVRSFTWFMGARHPAFQGSHGLYGGDGSAKPVVKVFQKRAAE